MRCSHLGNAARVQLRLGSQPKLVHDLHLLHIVIGLDGLREQCVWVGVWVVGGRWVGGAGSVCFGEGAVCAGGLAGVERELFCSNAVCV